MLHPINDPSVFLLKQCRPFLKDQAHVSVYHVAIMLKKGMIVKDSAQLIRYHKGGTRQVNVNPKGAGNR